MVCVLGSAWFKTWLGSLCYVFCSKTLYFHGALVSTQVSKWVPVNSRRNQSKILDESYIIEEQGNPIKEEWQLIL